MATAAQKEKQKKYEKYVKEVTPTHSLPLNMAKAFFTGGLICVLGHKKPGFEGGQMPLYRRLPKRGFTNRNSKEIIAINVDVLNRFEDGAEVTVESLLASSAISKAGDGVKILGNGELTKKLTVKVNAVSETAKSKIEAAGGTVELI